MSASHEICCLAQSVEMTEKSGKCSCTLYSPLRYQVHTIRTRRTELNETHVNFYFVNFRFMCPCIINVGEERTNRWHRYRCLLTIGLISACFGHHYAHRQENRLYKIACGVSLDVLAPHNRSQHIQANTTSDFIQSVLLTMGIMMPETCWD